jgi:hypothetical protein
LSFILQQDARIYFKTDRKTVSIEWKTIDCRSKLGNTRKREKRYWKTHEKMALKYKICEIVKAEQAICLAVAKKKGMMMMVNVITV